MMRGSFDVIFCAIPGIPPPKITWWKEHALLDDSYEVLPDGSVKNVLYLDRTNRKDLNTVSFF
jgi:hypothetical protein